jgi:predicted house-cleaning noncanonical NTP pyrophosphatase (MazG superfamily)
MKKYNKLVRDGIPKIIVASGQKPKTRKLKISEYKRELLIRLLEEAKEVKKAKNKEELIDELADIQEVMTAIYSAYKIECSDVTRTARKKRQKRGAFKNRIFLQSVD